MIYLSTNEHIKKILIENSIDQEDTKTLLQALDISSKSTILEITFLNIRIVSKEVFNAIYRIKNKVNITTNEKKLWHYLTKHGINNQYKNDFNNSDNIKEPIKAIVIGGSAGSIEKMLPIIKAIPYLDISIFVVLHILPDKKSLLSEIIQNVTGYKVVEALNHTEIQTGCLYVAKPNLHMVISDNHIYLNDFQPIKHARPSIDVIFKSLAYQYQSSLLAILLCGYGEDGSNSMKDLKLQGSDIIIEDPSECEAKDMPQNAIKLLPNAKILGVEKIRHYIKSALTVSMDIIDEMERFLENIHVVYGYDFQDYDKKSLSRRLELMMKQKNIDNFKTFERLVFNDDRLLSKLLSAFSINVTSFFRNPDVFKALKKDIIPYLESFASIRIWCAGCSRGAEPYSIAMILDEMGLLSKSQIYATDFNHDILTEARNAIYTLSEFEEAKENYLQSGGKNYIDKWFDIKEDFVQVKQAIKKKVIFFEHNLVIDSSINEFHLIFCRNVLIYFNQNLQKRVFNLIDESLFRNSFLVLGSSEVLPMKYKYKEVSEKKNKIYKKSGL